MKKIDRLNREYTIKYSLILRFLYHTYIGRLFLRFFNNKIFANIGAFFLNLRISSIFSYFMIKKYDINMSLYEKSKYSTYNSFFTRKLKKENINICKDKDILISPCDAKLMIFPINKTNSFKIKNSIYTLKDIIDDDIVNNYKNGYLLIFRLEISDYHHYCFVDDGKRSEYKEIKGKLHTVIPISHDKYKVYYENTRQWCMLKTKNFGDIIQVEVGALLVGKIINNDLISFMKGEEKGYFAFGGSSILLFVKDIVKFDDDIMNNSLNGNETIVTYGERIGIKWKKK